MSKNWLEEVDYEAVIRHECGHVVIALECGVPIKEVYAGWILGADTPGATCWAEPVSDWWVFCAVTRAGEVAQSRFVGAPVGKEHWLDDARAIKDAVREHCNEFPGFVETEEWWKGFFEKLAHKVQSRLDRPAVSCAFDALVSKLSSKLSAERSKYGPYGSSFTGPIGLERREIDEVANAHQLTGNGEWIIHPD
jgi:hypothetical protein